MKSKSLYLLLTILFIVAILIVSKVSIVKDYYWYFKEGASSFVDNPEYNHSVNILDKSVNFNVNLKSLDQYKGKEIYKDNIFSFTIRDITIENNYVKMSIDLSSHYNFQGGKIVKQKDDSDKNVFGNDLIIKSTFADGIVINGQLKGTANIKNGVNLLIFSNYPQDFNISNYDNMQVSVSHFIINDYVRK